MAALALATLTYALAQTQLIPSIPVIQKDFDLTAVGATSLITAFFVSGAVSAGIVGRLGDMFGKKRLLVFQMIAFATGAAVCAVGTSFPMLLLGRIVMGTALALFPLSFSLLRDILPASRVPAGVALIAGVAGMGAALGQASGGLITDHLGYHWIFWLAVLMGALAVGGLLMFVPESSLRDPGRVDLIGAALLAVALTGPLVAISQTPSWGWTGDRTLGLVAVGLAFFASFVRHERRHPDPLLDFATLRLRPVALTNLATVLIGFAIFGAAVIITQFLQEPESTGYGFGASPTEAGLFLVPGYVMTMAVAPVSGYVSQRAGARTTLIAGCAIGFTALVLMATSHGHRIELYLWPMVLYAGAGFVFGAMPTLILQTVPPELSGQSSAINIVGRNVGSSLGTQVAATFIAASVVTTSGLPSERGYTLAFTAEAVAAGLALLVALAIPRRVQPRPRPEPAAAAAASDVPI